MTPIKFTKTYIYIYAFSLFHFEHNISTSKKGKGDWSRLQLYPDQLYLLIIQHNVLHTTMFSVYKYACDYWWYPCLHG